VMDKKGYIDTAEYFLWGTTVIFGLLIFLAISSVRTDLQCEKQLVELGYIKGDVVAFRRATDLGGCTVLESPALQKQLDSFINGESTAFMQQAMSNKQASDAKSSGMATGMAIGIASGVAVSGGR